MSTEEKPPALQIDWNYLIFAWRDNTVASSYYLDVETGSVLLLEEDLDDIEELKTEIECQPNRYLYVPKLDIDQVELDLADFAHTVADEHLRKLLFVGMDAQDKVGACKVILSKTPAELARYEKWCEDNARERVKRWLLANNVAWE